MRGVDALSLLARPTSVAIVGGSADPSKIAGRPVKFLRRGGYVGEAFLVNPNLPDVEGYVSISSVASLPHPPDVAFVALGTSAAIGAVAELQAIGTAAAVVLASGFEEPAEDGGTLEQALRLAAGEMRLLGPNTLGCINMTDGVALCASDALETPGLVPGAIGLAAQSGGIMASLLSRAAGRGISYSKLFATGNEIDLEVADCIEFLAGDEATRVISLYLETLRDPERFLLAAELARSAGKAIVCYKVGRSEAGARAATSHTGALAGEDRVYDALFKKAGVRRVQRFAELLEIPAVLATQKHMAGRRVGVLTTTGGAGTLIADECGVLGLSLPPPDRALAAELAQILPGVGGDLSHNPIDLTLAGTRPEVINPMIERLSASDCYDGLVVVVGASAVAQPSLVADPVIACAARPGSKPILAYVSPHLPAVIERLNRNGVPAFEAPESCAAALAALVGSTSPRAPRVLATSVAPAGRLLNEHDSKELLSRYGIKSPARVIAKDPEEAGRKAVPLPEPFAIKVLARDLSHKSDFGGVVLDVATHAVAGTTRTLLDNLARARPDLVLEGVLIEEMVRGTELLLGMVRDLALGPAIVLGTGGIDAELIDETTITLPPIDLAGAVAMVDELQMLSRRGARLASSSDALAHVIVAFASMVEQLGPELAELEINPLIVRDDGGGVLAVDALVRFSTPT